MFVFKRDLLRKKKKKNGNIAKNLQVMVEESSYSQSEDPVIMRSISSFTDMLSNFENGVHRIMPDVNPIMS